MLNADAIKEITRLSQSEVVKVQSMDFHRTATGLSVVKFPEIECLDVFSLTQLSSFVQAWHMEEVETGGSPLIINVDGPDRVTVRTQLRPDLSRDILAEANMKEIHETFPFGAKLSQEDFIIKLMTQFEADDERELLGQVVSTVRAEKISEGEDDGISQVVSSKAGVHLTSTTKVQKFWNLKTYKTFPEVEQPVIPYMLRLHQRAEELPTFALYVCDGGLWKIRTTIAVRDWLVTNLKTAMGEKFGTDVIVL